MSQKIRSAVQVGGAASRDGGETSPAESAVAAEAPER
jgi:hypothetical protein